MSEIKVKRSTTTAAPPSGSLRQGEIAYSYASNKFFIGGATTIDVGDGEFYSQTNDVIGGKFFTNMLDHTAGTLTASSAIIVDSSKYVNALNTYELVVDHLTIDGNSITSADAGGTSTGGIELTAGAGGEIVATAGDGEHIKLVTSANGATDHGGIYLSIPSTASVVGGVTRYAGDGEIRFYGEASDGNTGSGGYVFPKGTGRDGQFLKTTTVGNVEGTLEWADVPSGSFTIVGDNSGATGFTFTTGNTLLFQGGNGIEIDADSQNQITLTLEDNGVTAATYGSATAVPQITVDSTGRVTGVTTAAISTSFTISDGTDTDTFNNGQTLTFTGSGAIVTSVTDNQVTFSANDATTITKGVAQFSSDSFEVNSGLVTLKSGGVANTDLANYAITIGDVTVDLGGTTTNITGLTELEVDEININGYTISTTNSVNNNQDIKIDPKGTGVIDASSSRITNVSLPVNDNDAANKIYVDNAVAGLNWKSAVNLLQSADMPLTGTSGDGNLEIDGHSELLDDNDSDGYRLLLINQTDTAENGIYRVVWTSTTWTLVRTDDADTTTELVGATVYVMEGTVYAGTAWNQTYHYFPDEETFTNQDWVQFSGASAATAGAGLSSSGNVFNVNVSSTGGIEINGNDDLALKSSVAGAGLTISSGILAVGGTTDKITVSADAITIASTYPGQTSINTLGTVTTGTWQGSTLDPAYGGTGFTGYTAGDIMIANGLGELVKLPAGAQGYALVIDGGDLPAWKPLDDIIGNIDGGTF